MTNNRSIECGGDFGDFVTLGEMDILWLTDPRKFPGYSLILPSVSIANIGQLAVDILIFSLPTEQIAVVHHSALLPIAGCGAYNDTDSGLTTSADLHVCHELKLLILQIRAPTAKGKRQEFVEALNKFIQDVLPSSETSIVWVLAGCQAANRGDAQLSGRPLRFYHLPQISDLTNLIKLRSLGPPALEEFINDRGEMEPFLPGAGLTKKLLDSCSLPCIALLMFVDEGENTVDAMTLASYCHAAVSESKPDDVTKMKWRVPPSWKNMFGAPAPSSIFL
ncbi:proteasome assembly chaperone 2 [Hyalella azteca]|uniref:Proteasome assembly chaperone 2 n=1 Tax=Hyalella azteca TaxID=294128 RepID=A0A8B7NYP6_HYAAZ|nr:proteasome assembly chaperone 2 [Hyalella azteca]